MSPGIRWIYGHVPGHRDKYLLRRVSTILHFRRVVFTGWDTAVCNCFCGDVGYGPGWRREVTGRIWPQLGVGSVYFAADGERY